MVTETYTLINTIKKMYPVMQFFKDRYFPDGRNYYSEKVLIECKKGGRRVAPFVVPIVNGIRMEAQGYRGYELRAPYIAPKMPITAEDLEKKAFGEDPNTNRSPADRENEIEAEHLDELRNSILRRHEQMCTSIILDGRVQMKHYADSKDAANDRNAKMLELKYYEDEFKNRYRFRKDFKGMTAQERLETFYEVASILRKRHVRVTDIVMTSDVSMLLMTDPDFLEYYNKLQVRTGEINQVETPAGVTCNGTINVNGVLFTMFTYDDDYEDIDGQIRPFLPAGTMVFIAPGLGETVYAQVTFVEGKAHKSYAEKIVARLVASDENNTVEVQTFSRPVPYPKDWDGWIVANINDPLAEEGDVVTTHSDDIAVGDAIEDGIEIKDEAEIRAMAEKADVIAYAESIGLTGLSSSSDLTTLKDAVIVYQTETYGD